MLPIQELIHRLEEGAGKGIIRAIFAVAVLGALWVAYEFREFRNLSAPEAMDAAQLARNISRGEGFTTKNVRPLSMWLVRQKKLADRGEGVAAAENAGVTRRERDLAMLRKAHPDLANAPVYPLALAGWMRLVPFNFEIPTAEGRFTRYQPDMMISILNQIFLVVAAVQIFFLGRRLFDSSVGWTSAAVFLFSELYWKFSVSGLPTLLAIVIFLAVVSLLARLEVAAREERGTAISYLLMGLAVGAVMALGTLTLYSFGWLMIPVMTFLLLFQGKRRGLAAAAALVVFVLALSPWLARNHQLSGRIFGIAGYAVAVDSGIAGGRLERSLDPEPELKKVGFGGYRVKFVSGMADLLKNQVPKLGGSWVTALFLAGLFIPFRSPTLTRLRIFLLIALATLLVAQALGRTHLTGANPQGSEITSENLLVVAAPLVLVFGVGMFYLLLGQMRLPFPQLRIFVVGGFVVLMSLPMLFTIPNSAFPVVYPPYYPPLIQKVSNYMTEQELMMSDIPAAVAWYGNRQCVALTLDMKKDFYGINDFEKTIQGLYLTPVTLDAKFLSEMMGGGKNAWGVMLFESLGRREIPGDFPLRANPSGFFPGTLSDQLFLSDRVRWNAKGDPLGNP